MSKNKPNRSPVEAAKRTVRAVAELALPVQDYSHDVRRNLRSGIMAKPKKAARLTSDDRFRIDAKQMVFEATGDGLRHIIWGLIALAIMRFRIPAFGGLSVFAIARYAPEVISLVAHMK